MATENKRSTVSLATSRPLSDLTNEAVRLTFAEDAADLAAFEERAHEAVISLEDILRDLKEQGRI